MGEFFRCNVCNVLSKGLRQHAQHLEGKRHKQNEASAMAGGSVVQGSSSSSQLGSKRQRRDDRDRAAVAAVSAVLDQQAAASRPTNNDLSSLLTHRSAMAPSVRAFLSGPPAEVLPSSPLPLHFASVGEYAGAFEALLVEEARGVLSAGLGSGPVRGVKKLRLKKVEHPPGRSSAGVTSLLSFTLVSGGSVRAGNWGLLSFASASCEIQEALALVVGAEQWAKLESSCTPILGSYYLPRAPCAAVWARPPARGARC